jgi:dTDP-4-dehydrorhamnose 3,5-epimerase
MEILRADDGMFKGFGQGLYDDGLSWGRQRVHYHKKQYDNMAVVKGMMKIVLYDSRKNSPTRGEVNVFFAGEYNPVLLHIPPFVYHGFKCVSTEEAIDINTPTEVYNYGEPDEFRVHPHNNDIPYNWDREDG